MLSARRALLAALTLLRLRGSPPPDGAEEAVGGAACKAARVSSLGRDADPENRGDVRFWLGGEELAVETSRGVNLVVVSPKTQEVVSAQAYDTWSQPGPESGRLRSDLEALPEGQVVLMGVNDTGMMEAMREQLAEALGSVGVTHLEHTFRASYALIGSKGGPAVAEDQASDRVAEVAGRIPCSAGCSIARVVSKEGFLQDGLPAFFLGGQRLEPELAAGISIVTFDPVSEEATGARSFPADADAQAEGGLSSYVASLPSDTIALVAVSGVRLSSLRRDTVRVLTALGASEPLLGRQGHEGYALIGSKGGWAVAEGVGEPAVVEGPLPCHGPGGVPTELPRGSGDFPGSSAEESNAAWPGGWQPQTLAEWPKDDYGAPEPCWKITVLRDVAGGWPGRCADLEPVGDGGAGPEACARLCRQSARCSAWRFGPGGCRHGQGVACDAAGDWERGAASQRLQRGEVRVLKKLERLEVVGLLRLSFESGARGSHSGALSHCREWCYSSIYCQYWQFSSRGECFVEAPSINESAAHYPLIVGLGARIEGSAAESMVEGEYIQHFCPPRPLSLREAQVVINRHVHEPEWWLEEAPSDAWPGGSVLASAEGWPHGAQPPPLAAWPKDAGGAPLPCRKMTILDSARGLLDSWSGDWLRRAEGAHADCQQACLWNTSCAAWAVTDSHACFHASTGPGPKVDDAGAGTFESSQWIQHGEVRVVRSIADLYIRDLQPLEGCNKDTNTPEECALLCSFWCYADVHCEYWQYGAQTGCRVDARQWGGPSPAYPLTSAGASPPGDVNHTQMAGEYVQHFCPGDMVVRQTSKRCIVFTLEVQGVDFSKIREDHSLLTALESVVSAALARAVGSEVQPGDVELVLTEDGPDVDVLAQMCPALESDVDATLSKLRGSLSSIAGAVAESASAVDGIAEASTGPINVIRESPPRVLDVHLRGQSPVIAYLDGLAPPTIVTATTTTPTPAPTTVASTVSTTPTEAAAEVVSFETSTTVVAAPADAATTLAADCGEGDNGIQVESSAGFTVGDTILIGDWTAPSTESKRIVDVTSAPSSSSRRLRDVTSLGSLALDSGLVYRHPKGAPVSKIEARAVNSTLQWRLLDASAESMTEPERKDVLEAMRAAWQSSGGPQPVEAAFDQGSGSVLFVSPDMDIGYSWLCSALDEAYAADEQLRRWGRAECDGGLPSKLVRHWREIFAIICLVMLLVFCFRCVRHLQRNPAARDYHAAGLYTCLNTCDLPDKVDNCTQGRHRVIVILVDAPLEEKTEDLENTSTYPEENELSIVYDSLLSLLDSGLAAKGMLQIFIVSRGGAVIQVHPHLEPPRSLRDFSRLVRNVLHEGKAMKAPGLCGCTRSLMRVVRKPVRHHLPWGCKVYGVTQQACRDQASHILDLKQVASSVYWPVAFVVGASFGDAVAENWTSAGGQGLQAWCSRQCQLTEWPMDAKWICRKVADDFEAAWASSAPEAQQDGHGDKIAGPASRLYGHMSPEPRQGASF